MSPSSLSISDIRNRYNLQCLALTANFAERTCELHQNRIERHIRFRLPTSIRLFLRLSINSKRLLCQVFLICILSLSVFIAQVLQRMKCCSPLLSASLSYLLQSELFNFDVATARLISFNMKTNKRIRKFCFDCFYTLQDCTTKKKIVKYLITLTELLIQPCIGVAQRQAESINCGYYGMSMVEVVIDFGTPFSTAVS